MLSTSAEDPVIAGLLKDANPWMVAGVLEGLSLAQVPRTEQLLDRLSADAGSGFLEEELRFGRSLLKSPDGDSKPQ